MQEWVKNVTAGKMSKSDKLGQVDHSTITYQPFRRSFYIEAQEIRNMTEKQVAEYRMQLEDIKVRGKDVPRPIKNWNQCGLSGRVMDVLKKSDFTTPMPIQVSLCSAFAPMASSYVLPDTHINGPPLAILHSVSRQAVIPPLKSRHSKLAQAEI